MVGELARWREVAGELARWREVAGELAGAKGGEDEVWLPPPRGDGVPVLTLLAHTRVGWVSGTGG